MSSRNRKAKGTRNEHRSIRAGAAGYSPPLGSVNLGIWHIISVGPADVFLK